MSRYETYLVWRKGNRHPYPQLWFAGWQTVDQKPVKVLQWHVVPKNMNGLSLDQLAHAFPFAGNQELMEETSP